MEFFSRSLATFIITPLLLAVIVPAARAEEDPILRSEESKLRLAIRNLLAPESLGQLLSEEALHKVISANASMLAASETPHEAVKNAQAAGEALLVAEVSAQCARAHSGIKPASFIDSLKAAPPGGASVWGSAVNALSQQAANAHSPLRVSYQGARLRIAKSQIEKLTIHEPTAEQVIEFHADAGRLAAITQAMLREIKMDALLTEARTLLEEEAAGKLRTGRQELERQLKHLGELQPTALTLEGLIAEITGQMKSHVGRAKWDFMDATRIAVKAREHLEAKIAARIEQMKYEPDAAVEAAIEKAILASAQSHRTAAASEDIFTKQLREEQQKVLTELYAKAVKESAWAGDTAAAWEATLPAFEEALREALRSKWDDALKRWGTAQMGAVSRVRNKLAEAEAARYAPTLTNGSWKPKAEEANSVHAALLNYERLTRLAVWANGAPAQATLLEETADLLVSKARERLELRMTAENDQSRTVERVFGEMAKTLKGAESKNAFVSAVQTEWVKGRSPAAMVFGELFESTLRQIDGRLATLDAVRIQLEVVEAVKPKVADSVNRDIAARKLPDRIAHLTAYRRLVTDELEKKQELTAAQRMLSDKAEQAMKGNLWDLIDAQVAAYRQATAKRLEGMAGDATQAGAVIGAYEQSRLAGDDTALLGEEVIVALQVRVVERLKDEQLAKIAEQIRGGVREPSLEQCIATYRNAVISEWKVQAAKLPQEAQVIRPTVHLLIRGLVATLISGAASTHARAQEAQSTLVQNHLPVMTKKVDDARAQNLAMTELRADFQRQYEGAVQALWSNHPISKQAGYEKLLPPTYAQIAGNMEKLIPLNSTLPTRPVPGEEMLAGPGGGGKGGAGKGTGPATQPGSQGTPSRSIMASLGNTWQRVTAPLANNPRTAANLLILLVLLNMGLMYWFFAHQRRRREQWENLFLGQVISPYVGEAVLMQFLLAGRTAELNKKVPLRSIAEVMAVVDQVRKEVEAHWGSHALRGRHPALRPEVDYIILGILMKEAMSQTAQPQKLLTAS